MTQEERVSQLFNRVRDYIEKEWDTTTRGAAESIQGFMRDECMEYNMDKYEWEYISATRRLAKLREYFHRLKNENIFP